MTKRTIVISRRNGGSRLKTKRNTYKTSNKAIVSSNAGFAKPVFVVLACAVFVALAYIYSINHNAVKGYRIKNIEREIAELKKDNEMLKIKEAQLKSLYRTEQSARDLNMSDLSDVIYIEENPSVAYGNSHDLTK